MMGNGIEQEPRSPNQNSPSTQPFVGPVRFVANLWREYPLVFWSGIFSLMLVVAGVGMSGLVNPDLSREISLEEAPPEFAIVSPIQETKETNASPLWSYASVVLSCMGGCLALSRYFRNRESTAHRLSRSRISTSRISTTTETRTGLRAVESALREAEARAIAPGQPTPLPQVAPAPAPETSAAVNVQSSLQADSSATLPAVASANPSAQESTHAPTYALPAANRPEFVVPVKLGDRERAPGLAELLDIRERRDKRSMNQ
ncbi:hypothetical protein ACQ4M4_23645 [Leptolyngbya sp. AN02str]|uniref:hypothetical protein n=1 Tax=Leptolyngbya sp. AN02str TaxID=3423363 RepID=UPI003D31DCF1